MIQRCWIWYANVNRAIPERRKTGAWNFYGRRGVWRHQGRRVQWAFVAAAGVILFICILIFTTATIQAISAALQRCLCVSGYGKREQWGGSSHTEKIANPVGKIIRSESGGACLARFYGGENDLSFVFALFSCEWMKIEPRIERLVLLLARTFRERP